MVVGMEKRNVGIPRSAGEPERMIFRQTKVIRLSLIHEREAAGRIGVPGVRRYHIERGLHLCFKELFRFRSVRWRGHSHASYTRDLTSSLASSGDHHHLKCLQPKLGQRRSQDILLKVLAAGWAKDGRLISVSE